MFEMKKQLIAAAVLAASLSTGVLAATGHEHDAHHGGGSAQLTLNNGQKWTTDENLRQGMANIRDALAAELPAIHGGKASAGQYHALAKKINDQVAFMVQSCKLDKEADAALHLVLAQLIAGADAMSDQKNNKARHQGAAKIIHALEEYAVYFDHPGWQGVKVE